MTNKCHAKLTDQPIRIPLTIYSEIKSLIEIKRN